MGKIEVFTVESGVPVPETNYTRIPLETLEVGESILFPLDRRNSVASKASLVKSKTGKQFTIKKQSDTNARIWRIQ